MERTSLLCPAPSTSDLAETAYTSFTPVAEGTGDDGTAELTAAGEESATARPSGKGDKKDDGKDGKAKAVLTPKEPGKPVTGEASGAESPALVGTAEGRFAPGWTVQQTTEVAGGQRPRPARHQLHRSGHRVLVPGRQHRQGPHGLRRT